MSTRGVADVVFCLDASASMRPCIDGVRTHLTDFITGLKSNPQVTWDLRIDFVAHSASETQQGFAVFQRSLYNPLLIEALYSDRSQSARFFTTDAEEFRRGLNELPVKGNEASLVALDSALDFPWRDARQCHRVVIFMTDEKFETGVFCDGQKAKLAELQQKIQQLRIMLYIVAPDSPAYNELAAVDRSEYEVVGGQGRGLADVDFKQVLNYIGKSVSVSTLQAVATEPPTRGLFGQRDWTQGKFDLTGQ